MTAMAGAASLVASLAGFRGHLVPQNYIWIGLIKLTVLIVSIRSICESFRKQRINVVRETVDAWGQFSRESSSGRRGSF